MVPRLPSYRDGLVQDVSIIHQCVERVATYVVENGMAHVQIGTKTYLLPIGSIDVEAEVAQLLTSITNVQRLESLSDQETLVLEPPVKNSG